MKIHFTVEMNAPGFHVHYLDAAGNEQIDARESNDPGQAIHEFKLAHRHAFYMTQSDFQMQKFRMAQARAKMAAWNEGRPL